MKENDVIKYADIKNSECQYVAVGVKLKYQPLEWQKHGLRQTVSGYGAKLTTEWLVPFNNRFYRVYSTCFSNCATLWFTANGKTYTLS